MTFKSGMIGIKAEDFYHTKQNTIDNNRYNRSMFVCSIFIPFTSNYFQKLPWKGESF